MVAANRPDGGTVLADQKLRVLILDDDPDDAFLVEDHILDIASEDYEVATAHRWEEAARLLNEGSYDALLCDYRLGATSGIEVVEEIRRCDYGVPVILLTGVGTRELDARALDAGAADFLAKDELTPALIDRTVRYAIAAQERQRLLRAVLDASGAAVMLLDDQNRLVLSNAVAEDIARATDPDGAVEGLVRLALDHKSNELRLAGRVLDRSTRGFGADQRLLVLQDVTDRARILEERERSARQLAHTARHDALTGLANRLGFQEAFEEWSVGTQSRDGRFALLSFDLDRFKDINDVYGHATGDRLLNSVARRLRGVCGSRTFLARLGGDEFVALVELRGSGLDMATRLADELLQALGKGHDIDGQDIICESSIGIAIFPDHGTDIDTLTANADLAMYRAKRTPTQACSIFDHELDASVRSDRALAGELRTAIERREIDIFVQPQSLLAQDRDLVGFEALARWIRHESGPVPPDRFIRVAERCGLILPLGELLLRGSVEAAGRWRNGSKIAINVSPVQLNHSDLPAILRQAMVDHDVSPGEIEIEITETALLEHTDRALHALRQVRAMGVSIALDDFGTGYSSLAMLQSFPFDKIKIDRSFVTQLDRHRNAALVRSIAQLGENLGIRVLCEGVERQSMIGDLIALGCHEMQGFLLAKPFPADHADMWARTYRAGSRDRDTAAA